MTLTRSDKNSAPLFPSPAVTIGIQSNKKGPITSSRCNISFPFSVKLCKSSNLYNNP